MLLKFFIILFIVIYVIARFAGFFLRAAYWFLGKPSHKYAEQFQREKEATRQAHYSQKKVGEVTINIPEKKKRNPSSYQGGEYVDFEEIDEK